MNTGGIEILGFLALFPLAIIAMLVGTFTVPRRKVPVEAGKTPLYQTQWAGVKRFSMIGRSTLARFSIYDGLAVVRTLFSVRLLTKENIISFEENKLLFGSNFTVQYRTPDGSEETFYLGAGKSTVVLAAMRQAGLLA